jgi:hypothetical protein
MLRKQQHLILALPICGVGLDFLENTLATIAVGIYPRRSEFLVGLLQISSLLKWLLIILSLLALLSLIIVNLINQKKSFHP